jgi:hypothetical protein
MVEMALVFPLLILLVMGVFEFGMAWRTSLTVSNALRSGARAAANSGDNRLADYNAVLAASSAMENITNAEIVRIIVYRADDDDGAVPSDCLSSSDGVNSGGVACNVYSADEIEDLDVADFATDEDGNCLAGSPDEMWCPMSRESRQSVGSDYVGVYIEVDVTFQTGLFGDGITIEDETVMRIEPEAH